MKYYTSIAVQGNNILFRGVNNGRRVKMKIQYSPTFFLQAKKQTEFKTLFGEYLEPMKFDTIKDARDFFKRYAEVQNFKIYGQERFEYAFIADEFKGQVDWDINQIRIAFVDIEVGSENGFPDPYRASEPITAICIRIQNGDTTVFGCGEYKTKGDEKYIQCKDEYDLCKRFMNYWTLDYPDVITGWNTEFFDIPYLVNRLTKILGEDEMKKLSPWGGIWERVVKGKHGRELKTYTITGVAGLDYIELYKWYAPNGKSQESYKLDHIASEELGEGKLSYDEYDNLHQLYKLDYQKFIEYNIKDVGLVVQLEDKLKLIELALTLAYDTKCNYEDVFAQTRMWDSLIYCYLLEKKIIVPPKEFKQKESAFEGAYVKDPQVGMHNWVASFDLNSLYPHLLMQYNLSPETLVEPKDYTDVMRSIIMEGVSVERLLKQQLDTTKLKDVTLTPNGQFFRTEKQGFLPRMMEELYEDRKKFKKMMLKYKQEYENEKDPDKKKDIAKLVARYDNLQLAKKLSLNSAYGVLGSQFFRFYDIRLALAVTQAGQLSIRWIEGRLNNFMNKLLKTEKDYVIASDTDSIYLRLGELVNTVFKAEQQTDKNRVIAFMDKVCEEKVQPYIDKSYQDLATYVHAYQQKMQMKRECLADKGIWTAKKRYILNVFNNEGVAYQQPKMKVMGLEMVKSSTPQVVRGKMYELIRLVVDSNEDTVQKFILDFKDNFKSLPPEEVSFPRGVNGLKEYADSAQVYKKGTPIHVKGALLYNKMLADLKLGKTYPMIKEGEKLKFAYLKNPNPLKDTVISYPTRLPKEFNLHQYIDYDMQFEKTFIEPVKTILETIGWEIEKQNSLESFFG